MQEFDKHMTKITDYQIVDHGMDGAKYFPGCGVIGSKFDYVATGCGEHFAEALGDALEVMSQDDETDGVDFASLEAHMMADEGYTEWPTEPCVPEDAEDYYYYVSIRYNTAEVTTAYKGETA